MSDLLKLDDVNVRMRLDENEAVFRRTQELNDEFFQTIREARDVSPQDIGETVLAARIPVVVVEKWMAEGFNIFDKNVTLEDIMKRLRKQELDDFIASNMRLY